MREQWSKKGTEKYRNCWRRQRLWNRTTQNSDQKFAFFSSSSFFSSSLLFFSRNEATRHFLNEVVLFAYFFFFVCRRCPTSSICCWCCCFFQLFRTHNLWFVVWTLAFSQNFFQRVCVYVIVLMVMFFGSALFLIYWKYFSVSSECALSLYLSMAANASIFFFVRHFTTERKRLFFGFCLGHDFIFSFSVSIQLFKMFSNTQTHLHTWGKRANRCTNSFYLCVCVQKVLLAKLYILKFIAI